ncbi:MAG: CbiX/SirB N-terminal domain-containing protein [Nocardioidaceae bacterium]
MHPALVAIAPGSPVEETQETFEALLSHVRRRLQGVSVQVAYDEHEERSFAGVMAASRRPVVVLPLLLAQDERVDGLANRVRAYPRPARIARPLGPHPLVAATMCQRLQASGARRGDAVVMMAGPTNDADGLADSMTAGRLLQAHWGAPVRVAHLSGAGRRVTDAVDSLWAEGHRRIAAISYFLAGGPGVSKARAQATVAGCSTIADELGNHPLLVELAIRRYLAAASGRPRTIARAVA